LRIAKIPGENAMNREETRIVKQIIKRYGAVIDLRENPQVILDILRIFADDPDGGLPPGGAPEPPAPAPPPGPSGFGQHVTLDDVMKQVLKVSREVVKIRKELAERLG
jgi:hypothetical protein